MRIGGAVSRRETDKNKKLLDCHPGLYLKLIVKKQRRSGFMTIKEVEEKTGLSRSNIRYYEKEGLVIPLRNEKNGYREYSQQDVEQIQKIAFLRTLNIPVETIREIMAGKTSLSEVLRKQENALEKDISDLERAKALCGKMLRQEDLSYENLNVQEYAKNLASYWEENKKIFRADAVSFIYLWGGLAVWTGVTVLCLLIALLAFPWLPEKIPVQWGGGTVSSSADKIFIFAYPAACVLIRFLLRPFIWRQLFLKGWDSDTVSDYISNFLCFTALSIEGFTILFLGRILTHITVIFALDALVFMGVLVKGWNRVSLSGDGR